MVATYNLIGKRCYASKATVEHAIRMARLAGIADIAAIEMAPDGTIRIMATDGRSRNVEDEIARWREAKRR